MLFAEALFNTKIRSARQVYLSSQIVLSYMNQRSVLQPMVRKRHLLRHVKG